jgi:hypothetical protein
MVKFRALFGEASRHKKGSLYFEYRSAATSGQSVLGWVTALSDIPIQGKMLIAAVGPRWCRHREEMIYTCTYSEMRILQLIVSGTLANAGRPERLINKHLVWTTFPDKFLSQRPYKMLNAPVSSITEVKAGTPHHHIFLLILKLFIII